MKPLYSLFIILTAVIIISKLPLENIIYEPIFYALDAYIKLAEALEHQSLSSLVSERLTSISHELQEQASRTTEKLIPMYKVLQEKFSALNKHTESNSDIDKHKSRFNFASVNGGAKIVGTRPSVKIGKAILVDDDDNYALYDCKLEPLEIVISLTEDVLIDTLLILNLENHASYFKDFEVLISTTYETQEWLSIGIFQTSWKKGWQKFDLPQKWARYVKLVLFSHHGSESLCTITQIKVLGVTMLENFRDEFLVKDEILAGEVLVESEEKPKAFFPALRREKPFDIHYSRFDSILGGKQQENKPVYLHLAMSPHLSQTLPLKGPYSDIPEETCEPYEFFFTNYESRPKYGSINFSMPIPPHDNLDSSDDVCYVYEFFQAMPKNGKSNRTQPPLPISKTYHKEILKSPQTVRRFRVFVSKMLTHLFQVRVTPPAKVKDVNGESTQIVGNKYMSELIARAPNFKYNIQDSMSFNILNHDRKADPHESIFKTLTRRLKGLEKSIILLEAFIEHFKQTTVNDITDLRQKSKTTNDQNRDLTRQVTRLMIKNEELEKRLENIEKTIHDINSPDSKLSSLSLIILLFLVLNIIWKILEKAAFSPVEQQRWVAPPPEKITGKSASSKSILVSTRSRSKKRPKTMIRDMDADHSSPALSNSNSMGDLHFASPNRMTSPLSGTTKPVNGGFTGALKGSKSHFDTSLKFLPDER